MRTISGPLATALSQPMVPIAQLVELAFTSGAIYLNTSTWDLVYDGKTYKGAYGLGTIAAVVDAPGEIKGLELTMSGVAAAAISLALDGADAWQGTPVIIRTAILNASYVIVDAPIEWAGRGDVMSINEDQDGCTISATAESTGVDLLRGSAMTYSHADQQSLYPSDYAFQYVVDQADKPIIWPSKWFVPSP